MFTIETYAIAVVFSVITMVCWGSWPNTQKLTGADWRFELFYWDYVWGIVLVAVVLAFTLGSTGVGGRPFLSDISQISPENFLSCVLGGVIFNAANIVFVAAIAMAGMSVAFPIGAGVGLVLGVVVNYLAIPSGNPYFLLAGVVLIAGAILLSALAHQRLSKVRNEFSLKGVILSVTAGILFGFFYRFIAKAMYSDFSLPEPGKVGPYSAALVFSLGVLASNFVFNTLLMRKPVKGAPVSYADYLRGSARDHAVGMLGGVLWGAGLLFSILSAGKAGFAVSFGLGQGNAMIAAVWGVLIWKEFKGAPLGTSKLLYWMFVCYIVGLSSIVYAKI
jgi:glucose uptake protein